MEEKNIREPIAIKGMFMYYVILIPNGLLFIFSIIAILLGKFEQGGLSVVILLGVFWSPFLLLFIFKFKKPKVLISKGQDSFIIHCITKDILVPMNTIRKISYWDFRIGIIYIKTETKFLKYKIRDVRDVDQVWWTMNSMLREYKDKMQSNLNTM